MNNFQMNNMSHSTTDLTDDQVAVAQQKTDTLIQEVREQLQAQTFDFNNLELMRQMVESFSDSRGMTRLAIAETFGEMIGKPATPVLLEGLADHPNPVVRRACAKTLTLIADPSAIAGLVHALLNDQDTVVQGSAVGALARTGKPAIPCLLEILQTPDHSESIKGHAAWALAFMGVEAKESLYQAFSSDSDEVRAAVVGAIANIVANEPEEQSFQILLQALDDSAEDVRSEAAAVLGNLAYQPAVPQLIDLLQHSSAQTRKSAALALMKINDKTALEPLKSALAQESEGDLQPVMQLAVNQLKRL